MHKKVADVNHTDVVKPEISGTSEVAVTSHTSSMRGTNPEVSGAVPRVASPTSSATGTPQILTAAGHLPKPEMATMGATAATVTPITSSAQHLIPRPAVTQQHQQHPASQQQQQQHAKPPLIHGPQQQGQQQQQQPFVRQNVVGSVMLHGVNIVSLVIDGKERLCLAQISNTLLKDYSYNEIHNRRVALGITCVQCTPVQLEILRRAGAMPVSSRRCGMITKREAERLVKSFLEDARPPRLPENFSFDVKHDCGWGSRGHFMPTRYNSSRAKCIKCSFCNMFFSPNKFIFHFHRTPESKYNHPDAANFNSWRRHLCLTDADASEELCHAWEDVKAMFNGGTRKRMLSTTPSSSSSSSTSSSRSSNSNQHSSSKHIPSPSSHPPQDYVKRPKMENNSLPSPGGQGHVLQHHGASPGPPQHYQYPVFPVPNKVVPMKSMPAHPAFSMPFNYDKPLVGGPENVKPNMNSGWPSTLPETYYPPYEMIWAKHLGLTAPESSFAHGTVPINSQCDVTMATSPRGPQLLSPNSTGSRDDRQFMDTASEFSDRSSMRSNASAMSEPVRPEIPVGGVAAVSSHMSAFRPVLQRDQMPEPEAASPGRSAEPDMATEEAMDDGKTADGMSDNEDVDVDTIDDNVDFKTRVCKYDLPQEENNNDPSRQLGKDRMLPAPAYSHDCVDLSLSSGERLEDPGRRPRSAGSVHHNPTTPCPATPRRPSSVGDAMTGSMERYPVTSEAASAVATSLPSMPPTSCTTPPRPGDDDRFPRDASPTAHHRHDQHTSSSRSNHSSSSTDQGRSERETDGNWKDFSILSRDALREELLQEIRNRRKLEEDCRMIKETFQEQVQREVAYRDEMAKQLQVVRETLCHELDQERKVRFSLQQKLKEAHDALHNFSCKMLASRQCSECSFKEPVMPR